MSSAARLGQRRRRGAEAAWLGICSSPRPVLRPARILRAARNTHSALTGFLAAPQRGQNGIEGNQGPKGNLALISSVEKLRLSRSVWSQVGSAVIAWRELDWVYGSPFPPPKKTQLGLGGLDLSLQLSFPPQLSPPEQAPASLAPRLALSVEWERRGVAWHRACTPPALCTRELLGRLSLVSSSLRPGHLD